MPKIKSTKEKLEEKGIFSKPVDLDPDWYGKHLRAKAEAEEKVRKDEEERIAKLACPLCKSTTKAHIVKSGSNDIIGPGYRSWVLDEYYVCKGCGVMYRDLTKLKEKR